MEIAIPILALGGLYVISNSQSQSSDETKKKSIKKMTQETFTNMGSSSNYLPNLNTPPQNYPVTNTPQLINTVQEYPNPNTEQINILIKIILKKRLMKVKMSGISLNKYIH